MVERVSNQTSLVHIMVAVAVAARISLPKVLEVLAAAVKVLAAQGPKDLQQPELTIRAVAVVVTVQIERGKMAVQGL